MADLQKDINMDVDGRHRDVRISVQGQSHGSMSFVISGGSGRKQPYDGPYTVTSEVYGLQIFPTENKVMTENLVVMPIPYSEVTNPKGGLTVCIGGE